MGFSRQEYWSRLPCLLPGDLPNPETESAFLVSPALVSTGKSLFKGRLYIKTLNKRCYSVSISKFNIKRDVKNEEKTKSQSNMTKAEAKGRHRCFRAGCKGKHRLFGAGCWS